VNLGTLCIPAGALRGRDLAKMTPAQLEALASTGTSQTSLVAAQVIAKSRKPLDGRSYHTEGMPNGLETDYANHLQSLLLAGEILFWAFEKIRLTLADRQTFLPDFFVIQADGTAEFHETKGYWREDARGKIKTAAQQFPCFVFKGVKRGKSKAWEYENFLPTGVRKEGKR